MSSKLKSSAKEFSEACTAALAKREGLSVEDYNAKYNLRKNIDRGIKLKKAKKDNGFTAND